jgi:hypothetical protein
MPWGAPFNHQAGPNVKRQVSPPALDPHAFRDDKGVIRLFVICDELGRHPQRVVAYWNDSLGVVMPPPLGPS